MPKAGARRAAQIAGELFYTTGNPCKRGHIAKRRTINGMCIVCEKEQDQTTEAKARSAAYRAKNAEALKAVSAVYRMQRRGQKSAYDKLYRAKNHNRRIAQDRAYYWANRDKLRAANKIWHQKNPDRARENHDAWKAANSEKYRELLAAWRSRNRTAEKLRMRQRYLTNRDEIVAQSALYRERNREAIRAYANAYYKANPQIFRLYARIRSARKRAGGGKYTVTDVRSLLVAQCGRCVYCEADIRRCYHIDHWMPLCLGGSNGVENIQLTCRSCNLRKGRRHPDIFEREVGYVRWGCDARSCLPPA